MLAALVPTACGWLLNLRAPSPAQASEAAALAIEVGAAATITAGDELTVHGDEPLDAWRASLEHALGWPLEVTWQQDELPDAADWDVAAASDAFPPLLLRPLWVAPVQCAVEPPEWSLPVRLLEGDAVFLTTTGGQLHASTRMLLELLAQR